MKNLEKVIKCHEYESYFTKKCSLIIKNHLVTFHYHYDKIRFTVHKEGKGSAQFCVNNDNEIILIEKEYYTKKQCESFIKHIKTWLNKEQK